MVIGASLLTFGLAVIGVVAAVAFLAWGIGEFCDESKFEYREAFKRAKQESETNS